MLQQFKNKYYKYWYILVYSFKQSNLALYKFLIFRIATVLQFCIIIYVWLLFKNDSNLITYLFIGYMIRTLAVTSPTNYVASGIFTGSITNRLLVPTNYTAFLFFKEIGARLISNSVSALIILLLLPFFFGRIILPSNIFVFLFPLILIIGFLIDFFFRYSIALTTFWLKDTIDYILDLISILTNILTGLYIPFQFLPSPLKDILPFNPYAWMSYHPMQIYLGNYNTTEILLTLLGGIGWIILLYFISQLVFKLGLKRYESEGL